MGKAVRKMELIKKENVRRSTFKKRKLNLVKKLHELTTLCDVRACMIVYDPRQGVAPEECLVWPENPSELLRAYRDRNQNSSHKTFGLSDFLGERPKNVEEEPHKLGRENSEAKYPTRPEILNSLDEAQLRQFAAALKGKAEHVKSRVEIMKTAAPDLMGFSEFNGSWSDIQGISSENFWATAGTDYESLTDCIYVGGPECPYEHEILPFEGELYQQNIEDCCYGVDDPVALKLLNEAREMPSLEPPEDESTRSLYEGGLDVWITEQDLTDNLYAHGEIENQLPPMPYLNIPPLPQQDTAFYPSMDPQRMDALVLSPEGTLQRQHQQAQLYESRSNSATFIANRSSSSGTCQTRSFSKVDTGSIPDSNLYKYLKQNN